MNKWNIEVFLTEKIVFIVGVGPAFQNIENIKRRSNKKPKSGREKAYVWKGISKMMLNKNIVLRFTPTVHRLIKKIFSLFCMVR
ncbi:hypothetical protein [Lactococcus cremoris]|uniref:hypothetical protein n=1 Tax=Lactococcus lactis subsp. cremoris TaxID=1359 RepID=UPI0009C23C4E|nr:hypothetical protein [Lactococcus cremoris]QRZ29301.1 hypothetical protein LLB26_0481 [Lactococcus cremoris]